MNNLQISLKILTGIAVTLAVTLVFSITNAALIGAKSDIWAGTNAIDHNFDQVDFAPIVPPTNALSEARLTFTTGFTNYLPAIQRSTVGLATACNPTNGSGGLSPGIHDTTFNGVRTVIVVGDGYDPNTPTYLGFHLHGDGGNILNNFTSSSSEVTTFINEKDWIFVAPEAPNNSNEWWTNFNSSEADHIQHFANVLDDMFAKYNICRNIVFGSSGSGGGVFLTNQFFPNRGGDYPSHNVLSCGAGSANSSDRNKLNTIGQDADVVSRTTFFHFYGEDDKSVTASTVEGNIDMYQDAGFNASGQKLNNAGHCNEWVGQGFPNQRERIVEKWADFIVDLELE